MFSLQWSTGFEGFVPVQLNQSAVAEVHNQLTGAITELNTVSPEGQIHDHVRLEMEHTCYWPTENISQFYQLGVFQTPSNVLNETGKRVLFIAV